ncbi:mitochondrial ACP precursor, putative [Babesia microti strain RI]|uniref:Mitochondrial ACP, putative n=1 Tax=Babesia microti (strain RI) TaxID=1133968 RepID=I7J635_BABMR|nr:mitochondrial ACP precursor, putative [Babesia microti strain RI]CCF73452.1 mitochondrial ACP precursor, putative [Babesia microti strain RI]|eukprot:XP_012648061.1 mitochondrial ACP precursor, putative [Babesia microti strain RI]
MPVRQLARCRWILSQLPILNDKTLYNIGVYRSSKLNTKRFIGTRNILHRDTDEIAKTNASISNCMFEELKLSAKITGNETLDTELDTLTHIDERKWDFLDTIEIVVKLEEKFGVALNDSVCNNIKTLKDLVDSFEKELANK